MTLPYLSVPLSLQPIHLSENRLSLTSKTNASQSNVIDRQPCNELYRIGKADEVVNRTAQINSSKRKEKNPHVSEQSTQPQDAPVVRPFGDCWFSPAARQDMKALKEEYHRLAKQYHPDVCGDRRGQQIFQEILNERAEILEQMSKE